MSAPVIEEAGIPALGTMLVIAGVALVLGLLALWLSRRHTHREAARDAARPLVEPPGRPADAARTPGEPPARPPDRDPPPPPL